MDKTTRTVVDYLHSISFDSLTSGAVEAVVRHHLDGVGCAAGGFASPPAQVAKVLARRDSQDHGASVYGMSSRVPVELATFTNTVMHRYLDFNDSGVHGHPNDMVPGLMAVAEDIGATGPKLILAIYAAYELRSAFAESRSVRELGWDQGIYCSVGVAAGLSTLLRLDEEATANAIALALTPSVPLRVTRTGEISMWKGAATAHAAMTAVFAVRLAQHGMTGPPAVFEGVDGVFERVTGPFQLELGDAAPGDSRIEKTMFKYYPAEFNTQVPISIALDLRRQFGLAEVTAIHVTTHHLGWHEAGGGQGDAEEKWNPTTRETADHSLPFTLAVALVDGEITPRSFDRRHLADPRIRELLPKISVEHDEEFTRVNEELGDWPAEIAVTLADGRRLVERRERSLGQQGEPMSDHDLEAKFDTMVGQVLDRSDQEELKDRLWRLAGTDDLAPLTNLFRRFAVRGEREDS